MKWKIIAYIYGILYHKLSLKLGFSIDPSVLGYGTVIPHYGTIVVGSGNSIGHYAVLHTSTCITAKDKIIGDGLYLSTGVKIISKVTLGDNISIGANSMVNKDFIEPNCMIAGSPARIIKETIPWYIRDNREIRVKSAELLREKMNVNLEV